LYFSRRVTEQEAWLFLAQATARIHTKPRLMLPMYKFEYRYHSLFELF